MKKCLLLFAILISNESDLYSQSYYERNYCKPSLAFSYDAFIAEDSSLYITGESRSNSNRMSDLLLLNIDKSGNQKFMYEFGSYDFDYGYSLIQDSLNNVYLLGSKVVGDTIIGDIGTELEDFFLVKTNSEGKVLWEKIYNFSMSDIGLSIVQKNQDTLILIGTSYENEQKMVFLKIDSAGNKIKEVLFDENVENGTISIIKPIKESLLIAFTSSSGIKLKRIDFNGNELWSRIYNDEDNYHIITCNSIKQTKDFGYIIVGEIVDFGSGSNENVYLLKLDSNYNVVWGKSYGYKKIETGLDVVQTNDNGFLICGQTLWTNGANRGESFLLRIGESGDSLWRKDYGLNGRSYLTKIIPIKNGFYSTGAIFLNNDWDVLVVKTDSLGKIDTSYLQMGIHPSIKESNSLLIYPNPTTDKLYYKFQDADEKGIFHIYNLTGQLIQSGQILSKEGCIDLSNVHSDLILVRFIYKEKEIIKKVFIEK